MRSLVLQRSRLDPKKRVVIVRGGPGTGKSVVAVNLLAALTAKQKALLEQSVDFRVG